MFAFMISRLAETRQMLCDWYRKVTLQDLPRAAKCLVNELTGNLDAKVAGVAILTFFQFYVVV